MMALLMPKHATACHSRAVLIHCHTGKCN